MPPIDAMTVNFSRSRAGAPGDQADGLRRMFGGGSACLVPVVANPNVEHQGALLARVAAVFAEQGLNTLVVDAADTAPEPGELAFLDLGGCVEALAPRLAYLAARGLPMQSVDTHGSCARFIPKMMDLVPGVDVVVMHAEVRVLCRMLGQRELRPILIGSAATDSLTHTYAALKMMTQRLGLMSFDLVLPTSRRGQPSPQQIADRVADCADRFLGAALRDWAGVDPHLAFDQPASADLVRLAAGQLELSDRGSFSRRTGAAAMAHGNAQNAPLFA
jgi:flagellar biosynthesis protein FlhG